MNYSRVDFIAYEKFPSAWIISKPLERASYPIEREH